MNTKNLQPKQRAFTIRHATIDDVPTILKFIKALARFEQMSDQVIATEESLLKTIFHNQEAEVIIAEENNEAIGFALYFQTYSTFLAQSNIYLEDLYINEDKRHLGYGKLMLSFLAEIAVKRKAKRLEWVCLNWNQKAINFYQSLGAKPLQTWTTFRLSGDDLISLSLYTSETN